MEKPTVFVVSCHDYRELKTDVLAVCKTYSQAVARVEQEMNSVQPEDFRVIDQGSVAMFFSNNYDSERYKTDDDIYNAGGSMEFMVFITAMPLEG